MNECVFKLFFYGTAVIHKASIWSSLKKKKKQILFKKKKIKSASLSLFILAKFICFK